MASLLASLDSLEKVAGKKSKKEGRKHSKREKEAKKNSEDGVPRLVKKKASRIPLDIQSAIIRGAYETCYETQSEDEDGGVGKKKKKGWKSKHKNVIDPVFLGELEHLIQDISCCQLELKLSTDLWPDRPSDCVPSIFRRRKIQTPTKRRKDSSGKVTKRAKAQKQGSQQQQAEVAILDLTESDEQRLPLKKRHHHLQAEGKEGKGVAEKRIGTLQVKSPEKICREFRISSKVRGDESTEGCLSPSKMLPQNEMRSGGPSGKNIQEKLLKKPTAADRIVEKLGIQIKKESLEINNESKLGRPGKVSDRTSRRISKELDFTKPDPSPARNTKMQETPFTPVVKHESKTKSFTESTFVDSIQDCIEKYTNASSVSSEKPKLRVGGDRESMSKTSQNLSQKFSQKQQKAQGSGDSQEGNYVTLFSSPEHEVNITSGRNSSMSQSSTSSDSCSIINLDPEPEMTKSRMGRASSRQDLHSHLWKQDEPSQPLSSSASSSSTTVTSKAAAYRSLVSETMRKRGLDPTSRPQTSSTKPLPTEPIRRVDLVQGYCHKPLDKSGRPLSGQECLIRKVPQAIVAPFRRNPPEPPMAPVVPIHRASIAAHTTSTAAEALLNATTSLTASLPPIAPASAPPDPPAPATPMPAPAQSPPKESPASPASSCKKRGEEPMAKEKEKEKEREDSAATIPGSSPPEHPKTRSKLELEAKLENTKKEAKIKRCKVAVERLDENISRRALLGVSSLEKKVADLQVTETERSRRRRGSVETEAESGASESERRLRRQVLAESEVEKRVADLQVSDTDRPRRRRGSIESDCKTDKGGKGELPELCVTKQLEVLERSRQSLVEENCHNGGKMGSCPAEPTPAAEKKENDGGGSESGHKLEKISDKPELTQSSPAVLGTEDRNEGDEEKLSLEKQSEVLRKRRRKTNKTGFPSTMKKKRRVEHENSRQQWVSFFLFFFSFNFSLYQGLVAVKSSLKILLKGEVHKKEKMQTIVTLSTYV